MTEPRIVVPRMGVVRRVIHWANVVAVVVCVITGMYIADPYYSSGITHVMSVNRTLHFYGAVILDVTVIVTAYLYVFSREHRAVHDLVPTTRNRRRAWAVLTNVVTFDRVRRFDTSRPDPLNQLWFAVLHLLAVLQLCTGFQMYVQALESGQSSIGRWWPALIHLTTDWTQAVFGGLAGIRLVHHATTYPIAIWVLLHVYYEVWRSVVWREGDVAISIVGYKTARPRQFDASPERSAAPAAVPGGEPSRRGGSASGTTGTA